jgi:hypothetical protein
VQRVIYVVQQAANGRHLTVDDFGSFVSECVLAGVPGNAQVDVDPLVLAVHWVTLCSDDSEPVQATVRYLTPDTPPEIDAAGPAEPAAPDPAPRPARTPYRPPWTPEPTPAVTFEAQPSRLSPGPRPGELFLNEEDRRNGVWRIEG